MTTRNYSSFLLRLWLINDSSSAQNDNPLVLQIQHLQSGTTWRLHSLEELQLLLQGAMDGGANWVSSVSVQIEEVSPDQPGISDR